MVLQTVHSGISRNVPYTARVFFFSFGGDVNRGGQGARIEFLHLAVRFEDPHDGVPRRPLSCLIIAEYFSSNIHS